MKRDRLWRALFLRQEKIPDSDCQQAIFAASDQSGIRLHIEASLPQLMKHREIVEDRFGNAVFREQAEAAIERRLNYSLLFEHVGERPIAHAVDKSIALSNGVSEPRSHERAIGHFWLIAVVGVELAPDQWKLGVWRGGNLIVHFLHRTAHHLGPRNIFVRTENVFGFVVAVDMRGDEINRDIFLFAMREKTVGPSSLRGCRS